MRALVDAGADVNARFRGPHAETPLHWAASTDDVDVLDALIGCGAAHQLDPSLGAIDAAGRGGAQRKPRGRELAAPSHAVVSWLHAHGAATADQLCGD